MFYRRIEHDRQRPRGQLITALVALTALPLAAAAQITTSGQPAAIVDFPLVRFDQARGVDTLIRFANTTDAPIVVHCFYVDENRRCSSSTATCIGSSDCGGEDCIAASVQADFVVRLTPYQPIAWLLGNGLEADQFPIDGVTRMGSDGSSNVGSAVPPAPVAPFSGWLQCIAVDSDLRPVDENCLTGDAVLYENSDEGAQSTEYSAVGIQAFAGASDGNATLFIGSEYSGCSNVVTFNHFFDGASDPAVFLLRIETTLVLVPCSVDFTLSKFGDPSIEYLIVNEFAQRFILSGARTGTMAGSLSHIDGQQPTTSPYSVGVAGSLTGKTRLRASQSGVLGIAIEERFVIFNPNLGSRATAFNLHGVGIRPKVDTIVLP